MPSEAILVVDDNLANLKLMRTVLVAEGYQVETAVDAADALSKLESFRPRLVLMDIQLPVVDGLELTRRIKENPRFLNVRIVAVTSYAMKGDEERILSSGCDGYIAKPIDTRRLPSILRGYLDGAER
ncbi:MAG TPA: response regulator [Bdellovibrionota bacterium]|nr:response regulator [Bdellovibrionota bacterium]